MTPDQRLVYDNYIGWFLTTLKWATDAKSIPLADLDAAVKHLKMVGVLRTPADERIHLSLSDLQAHERLYGLIGEFLAKYLEWEAEARGGMSSGLILPAG